MATIDRRPGLPVPGDGFDAILARARRLAARLEGGVGERELLLGLASMEPRQVIRHVAGQGLNAARLTWAAREWWPTGEVAAARADAGGS